MAVIEVTRDGTFQSAYLVLIQIVFGNSDIRLQNPAFWCILPGSQSHMVFTAVCLAVDDFCSSLPSNGVVEFVLHHRIEVMGDVGILVIVNAAFPEDVGDFLPDTAFACPNGTDTFEQFIEIVFAESCLALFQAFVIKDKALDHVFFQDAGCPDTELGCSSGIDPIADGNDGI